jgi:uncharacterized membrane protein
MPFMNTHRLEAFTDGVLAIVITIMVLELKIPHSPNLEALRPLLPALLSYLLSFVYVAIYWNNHHHMLHATKHINGPALWANMHLLFWLSLIPFVTGWMGENSFAPIPTAFYGLVLLLAAIAYFLLQRTLIAQEGASSMLGQAIGRDFKGKLSIVLYLLAVPMALYTVWPAELLYFLVALIWILPDRRIERRLQANIDNDNA